MEMQKRLQRRSLKRPSCFTQESFIVVDIGYTCISKKVKLIAVKKNNLGYGQMRSQYSKNFKITINILENKLRVILEHSVICGLKS